MLLQGVSGITDLITTPGLINLDFADVKSVMANAGSALMGIGSARGEDRAVAAAEMAVSSPLLEASIEGAHGVLLSIAGGSDLGLFEINEAAALVAQAAHAEANIIFGATIDDALGDEVRVTVIAAGFDGGMPKRRSDGNVLRPTSRRRPRSRPAPPRSRSPPRRRLRRSRSRSRSDADHARRRPRRTPSAVAAAAAPGPAGAVRRRRPRRARLPEVSPCLVLPRLACPVATGPGRGRLHRRPPSTCRRLGPDAVRRAARRGCEAEAGCPFADCTRCTARRRRVVDAPMPPDQVPDGDALVTATRGRRR